MTIQVDSGRSGRTIARRNQRRALDGPFPTSGRDQTAENLALLEAAQEIGGIGTFVAWLTPEKAGVDEWSKTCMEIFGYDQRTFDGTNEAFWRRVHPADVDMVRRAQAAAHEIEGGVYDVRHRIVRSDGEVRWIRERAVSHRDASGAPIYFVGVAQDITDEMLAASALRASEARNAAIIHAAVDCLVVMDAEGRITTFNPAAERVFGYRGEEVMGRDLLSLIVPERHQTDHREALRQNLLTGSRHYLDRRIEVTLRRADGAELPAEVSVSRFEVDGVTSFSMSIRDLSDRHQLLASRELLAEVVANTPVMLFAYDSDGKIILAEGSATAGLLGVDSATAVGLSAFDLMKDVPEALDHLKRGLAGETFAGTIDLPALGAYLEARYRPTLDPQGKVIGMTGMAIDVSDRVKGAEAREESDAKSRLVAVVNHELRTPLTSILGFTELLLSGAGGTLSDKQTRYATNVDSAGRHLLALINDSLDLSRIAAGKIDLEICELNLVPLLEEAAAQVQPLVNNQGLQIRQESRGELVVLADRRRLLQVLWNLLSNAIRHTASGGVITLVAKPTKRSVAILVRDTGIGIAAEQIERIFEEYTQAEGQSSGTGLGLPVSRRLAKLMGGDIKVISRVGRGSTFTVTLPRWIAAVS